MFTRWVGGCVGGWVGGYVPSFGKPLEGVAFAGAHGPGREDDPLLWRRGGWVGGWVGRWVNELNG